MSMSVFDLSFTIRFAQWCEKTIGLKLLVELLVNRPTVAGDYYQEGASKP